MRLCPVIFTLSSIGLFYYFYFYLFTQFSSSYSLYLLCFFHIFLFLSCLSLIQIMLLDPGRVPKTFEVAAIPEYDKLYYTENIVDKYYLLGRVGYCVTCKRDRPHRAHHCNVCNLCTMRYEHHCIFLGTCIGLKNVKLFILFLFYSALACGLVFVHCFYILAENEFSWPVLTLEILSGNLLFFFLVFSLVQFANVCLNITGVEYKWEVKSMFDVGVMNNISQVFGDTFVLWFVPIENCESSGLKFPMKIKYKDEFVLESVGQYLI